MIKRLSAVVFGLVIAGWLGLATAPSAQASAQVSAPVRCIGRRYAGRCTACRCTACRKARTAPRVAPVQTRRSAQVDPVGRPGRQGMHGKLGQCRLRLSLKAPMLADTL